MLQRGEKWQSVDFCYNAVHIRALLSKMLKSADMLSMDTQM